MITCTRRIEWDMGHRVMNHEGRCRNMHGHRYRLDVTAGTKELDAIGRIIDFSVLKSIIGGWIDQHLDHGFLVYDKDVAVIEAIRAFNAAEKSHGQKVVLVPFNPTAENIVAWLVEEMFPSLLKGQPIEVIGCTLYETPNCSAEYTCAI